MATWLCNRRFRGADQLSETAIQAVARQHTDLPGEKLTPQLVHTLSKEMALIKARFRTNTPST